MGFGQFVLGLGKRRRALVDLVSARLLLQLIRYPIWLTACWSWRLRYLIISRALSFRCKAEAKQSSHTSMATYLAFR
jgi:hypothetical protein